MALQERKARPIQSILTIGDEELLARIEAVIGKPKDWALDLTQAQRDGILTAMKSLEEGKGIPDEDIWAEFDPYFAEKMK